MNHLDICHVFAVCFAETHRTRLCGGANEPRYLPPAGPRWGELRYREDFAASALHETAHWCIAGERRRLLEDFGYSYIPPPRTLAQQQAFFDQELRTQSLEAVFAEAAGVVFHPSADQIGAELTPFTRALEDSRSATLRWLQSPAGRRAGQFR